MKLRTLRWTRYPLVCACVLATGCGDSTAPTSEAADADAATARDASDASSHADQNAGAALMDALSDRTAQAEADAKPEASAGRDGAPDGRSVPDAANDGTLVEANDIDTGGEPADVRESGADGPTLAAEASSEAGGDSGAILSVSSVPGYVTTIFATGGTDLSGPDSIALDGSHVWVGYQMGTKSKDGTDAGPPYNSKVVQYDLFGAKTGKSFEIPGHCDGVRVDPATHVVWATSNEDGNPIVRSYDPAGVVKDYTLPAQAHGGGLDDIAFVNGKMIVVQSAPQHDPNTAPALSSVTVNGNALVFAPVLLGDTKARDLLVDAGVTLNLQDPDSLSIDDMGRLVLVDQGDSQLLFIKNPGNGTSAAAPQSVTRLPVGTQLDDTVWTTQPGGMLLVADATLNTVFAVRASFKPGTIYTEAPDDSGVASFVGTLDGTTGSVTPIIVGFKKPTGLLYVPAQ